jgi:hypothetical protein
MPPTVEHLVSVPFKAWPLEDAAGVKAWSTHTTSTRIDVRIVEAEVAVVIQPSYGLEKTRWFDFAGSYWRPVVSDSGRILERRGHRGYLGLSTWEGLGGVRDYPFQPGPEPVGSRSDCGGSYEAARDAAVARVARAATKLVCIDGVICKKAPLPCWRLGDLDRANRRATRVHHAYPDLMDVEDARDRLHLGVEAPARMGMLPADCLDEALALSRDVFGVDRTYPRGIAALGGRQIKERATNDGGIEVRMPLRLDPALSVGLADLHARLTASLDGRDPWEVGGNSYLSASVELAQAVGDVRRRPCEGDALGALADAAHAVVRVLDRECGRGGYDRTAGRLLAGSAELMRAKVIAMEPEQASGPRM